MTLADLTTLLDGRSLSLTYSGGSWIATVTGQITVRVVRDDVEDAIREAIALEALCR